MYSTGLIDNLWGLAGDDTIAEDLPPRNRGLAIAWVLFIMLFPTKRDIVTYLGPIEAQIEEFGKLFMLDRHLRKEGERDV